MSTGGKTRRPAAGKTRRGQAGQAAGPGPGEEFNAGQATAPRQAATVILLRGGADGLEVLLVRRSPRARFMGGVWVFPGGAVDDNDLRGSGPAPAGGEPGASGQTSESEARALRAAATRELREEAGIALADTDELIPFSRWITPAEVRTRYDTHFFLAVLPPGQKPRVDGRECVEWRWFAPQAALAAHAAGEIALVFPTIKHLEELCSHPSADALLAQARGRDLQPVQPRVVVDGEVARVLLPGDPGY